MSRILLQAAYVIHLTPYRNSSALVELLTHDYGRITVVAKGVRKAKTEHKGLLQPFSSVLVSYSGRSELMTLIAVERDKINRSLTGTALFSGLYMNELLLRLLHRNDPHPGLYAAYQRSLITLSEQPDNPEPILRYFEKHLLLELGYGLNLEQDAVTGLPIEPAKHYRYEVEQGPIECEPSFERAGQDKPSNITNPVVSGRCLQALATEMLAETDILPEMKHLLRYVLAHYLKGKPLKSRELFNSHSARASCE